MDESGKDWFGRLKELLKKGAVTIPPHYLAAQNKFQGMQQQASSMSGQWSQYISGSSSFGFDVQRPSIEKLFDSAQKSLPLLVKGQVLAKYQPYYDELGTAMRKWLRTGEPTDWRDMLRLYEKLKASIEAGGSPTSELTVQAVVSKLKEKP